MYKKYWLVTSLFSLLMLGVIAAQCSAQPTVDTSQLEAAKQAIADAEAKAATAEAALAKAEAEATSATNVGAGELATAQAVAEAAKAEAEAAMALAKAAEEEAGAVEEESSTSSSEPIEGGTLIVGWSGEPQALDALSNSLATTRITSLILENLVAEDTTAIGQSFAPAIPGLAESWDVSEDGLIYTFHLRQGVDFTDGTPFDAEAVKANFDRVMDPNSPLYYEQGRAVIASRINTIDSYRVVDPFTFEITLKEPFGPFINSLKHRTFGIISPAALESWSQEMTGEHLVGTGPFKFVEREQGVKVVLGKNPDYWNQDEEPVYLDEVIFRIMPDTSARLAALQTGEIDVELEVPADRTADLDAHPDIEVVYPDNAHIAFWIFNHENPASEAIKNPLVRQAIWHAIDTEGMVNSLFGDTARPMDSMFPVGNPGYRSEFQRPYPYDPEKAKELLAEAGYSDGLKLNIGYPQTGSASYMDGPAIAQWVQANLLAVGIETQLELYEWATWVTRINQGMDGGIDVALQGWQSIADDPFMLDQLFASYSQPPNGVNRSWYNNPDVDVLLLEARSISDDTERTNLYMQAEDLILQDVAAIPIAHSRQPRAYHKRVHGLAFGPSTWFELTGVWVEQ